MSNNCTLKGIMAMSFSFFILISGCSRSEDDSPSQFDPFYRGALVDADLRLLNKYWSIFQVNYEQETVEIPKSYDNCDRDFFTFLNDGAYKDYIILDSGCIPNVQDLQWSFNKGVITLENSFKDYSEMVLVYLTADQLIFRAKFDIDDDGEEDILQFLAKPHIPDETYFYNNNLIEDETVSNKIRLMWSEYEGIHNFDRYEIYLSGEYCDLSKASLVGTIRDKGTTYFEDVDPPVEEQFCYFLKVYTDKGLLFTSYPLSKGSYSFDVPSVGLEEPIVLNDKISLQWERYEGLYFSHYEIFVKNFLDEYGWMSQEESLIKITDINTTNFIDEAPPLVKDPVYEIRVYNKFGEQSYYNPQVARSSRAANYLPKRVLELHSVLVCVPSPDETVVFLNGNRDNNQGSFLIRYNYATGEIEAVSNTKIHSYQLNRDVLKIVDSPIGRELMYLINNNISVFDAKTLQYKYDLKLDWLRSYDDFIHLDNDRFLLLDYKNVYTVSRDFSNLTLIDSQEHFLENTGQYTYRVLPIDDDRIIIGNRDQAQSVIFNVNSAGNLLDKRTVDIPITAIRHGETLINSANGALVNFQENRVYNLASTAFRSFEQPYFPLALSRDGTKVMGTNNDPKWNIQPESLHSKQVRILDLNNSNISVIDTEGYPHYLFENHLGQIISLSTYFKRDNAYDNYDRPDFFMEIVGE